MKKIPTWNNLSLIVTFTAGLWALAKSDIGQVALHKLNASQTPSLIQTNTGLIAAPSGKNQASDPLALSSAAPQDLDKVLTFISDYTIDQNMSEKNYPEFHRIMSDHGNAIIQALTLRLGRHPSEDFEVNQSNLRALAFLAEYEYPYAFEALKQLATRPMVYAGEDEGPIANRITVKAFRIYAKDFADDAEIFIRSQKNDQAATYRRILSETQSLAG